jgi:2,5-diketo-D-gluconate reductase A
MQIVTLSNETTMPVVGYGVFQIPDAQECTRCVIEAIEAGYRHIDSHRDPAIVKWMSERKLDI